MRPIRILPLLALVPLPGCDTARDWVREPAAEVAYAAPLASDTSVVTTRRVWSWSRGSARPVVALTQGTIMPDGAGLAGWEEETGNPVVFDLASNELHRFPINSEPYDTGLALFSLPSPDGRSIAVDWQHFQPQESQLRIIDVATGASRTIMTPDPAMASSVMPVAWTPAGDSVFASLARPDSRENDVKVVLVPVAGGVPRLVHTIPRSDGWGRMSLSPDGRWLLYAHEFVQDEQSRSDIHIIDVQSGGARPLVQHPAVDRLVGWLPDTDIVLFSSDRSGTTDLWGVRVVDGRTSAQARLVRSGFFRSEAVGFGDGALFYQVETGSSGPAVVGVDAGSGAVLGPASSPLTTFGNTFYRAMAWSPDGQTLAVPNWGLGVRRITLHSMESGESRVFWLDEDVHPLTVEWAADGKALFIRAEEAWDSPTGPHRFLRLDLVTGTTTPLFPADPEEPTALWRFLVTPDGRSLVLRQQRVFDDDRTEIRLVLRSLEDGSERELYRTSGFIPEFGISADGTQLAFVKQIWGEVDSLFVMGMDGSQPLRAVANWNHDAVSLLGWLPAGDALLAARLTGPYRSGSSGQDGPGEEILRIELDGSITAVGNSPFRPMRGQNVQGYHRSRLLLSPAGNQLVHLVSENTGEELWRMDGLHELFADDSTGRR